MNAGRPPDFERYRQVLRWIEAGKTRQWIAEKLGLKLSSTHHLISRAQKWQAQSGLRESTRSAVHESLTRDEVLKIIDEIINDGLKVQADVVRDALAATRAEVAALAAKLDTLAKSERAEPVAPAPTGRPSNLPPPGLWLWIVQECTRQIGMTGMIDQLEVDESILNAWLRGTTPSSRHREELKRLLATVWARDDLFDDLDDLLDARDRLPTAQNAGAL